MEKEIRNLKNEIEQLKKELEDCKQELNKSSSQKEILKSIPNPASIIGLDYRYIYVNEEYSRVLNLKKEQIEGKHVKYIVGEEAFQNSLKAKLDQCLNGEKVEFVASYPLPDKKVRIFNTSYNPYYSTDGRVNGIVVISKDISEKNTEIQKLKESEERFRAVFKQDQSVKLIIAPESGKIIDANKAACEFYGYSLEKLTSKNIQDINQLTQQEVKQEMQWLIKSMINAFVLFESVFDNDGKFISYRFVYINEAYERITGVKLQDVKGKTVHEVWPETEPEWIEKYGRVAVTGKSDQFDLYHDPTKKLYHCKVYRPYETNKKFCVVFDDITEKNMAEKGLKESKEKFKSLFSSSPDAILIANAETGIIVDANKATEKLFERPLKEIIGLHQKELHPQQEEKKVRESFRDSPKKLGDPASPVEIEIITGSDKIKVVEIIGKRILINNRPYVFGNFRDITERKIAEQSLKDSEEKHRSVLDNTLEGIFVLLGTQFMYANPAIQKLTGYTLEEIKKLNFLDAIHEDDRQMIIENNKRRLAGEDIPSYDFRILSKDGTAKWYILNATKIFWEGKDAVLVFVQDINERKLAEQKLRKALEEMKFVTQNVPNVIWKAEFDEQYNFINTYISDNVNTILNLPQETIKNDWDKYFSYVKPEYLETIKQTFAYGIKNPGVEESFTYEAIDGKGDTIWLQTAGKVIEIDGTLQTVGYTIDVTEKVKSKEALKISETRYQNVINNVLEGIFVIQDDYVVYANPAVERITGYELNEMVDRKFIEAVFEEDRQMVLENYNKRMKGETLPSYDFRIKAKDGSVNWFLINATKINWEGKDAALVFIQDINDRKLAETALVESEEKYREIVEMSPDGIVTISLTGKILSVNKSFNELTGYEDKDFVGKNYLKAPTLMKQDLTAFKEIILSVLKGKISTETIDFRWKHKSGEVRDGQARVKLIKKGIIPSKIQAIVRDVTEQKRTQKLKNEVEVAQNSAKLKQKFLANISHEMRTPMNGIIGMTEFLIDTQLNSEQQDYVNTIKDSSESLLHIINDVLNLSKIEQGQVDFIFENVNIKKLIVSTMNIFQAQALKKDIELGFQIEANFPTNLLLDKQSFRQILYNLISNAIKYTAQGEVKLDLICLKKKKKKMQGKVIVSDTGIGIKEQDKKKIFDPFVRVDDSLTRTTEGTGLGLSITKTLVEMFGGEIGFDSEMKKGSTFWFTFESEIMPYQEELEEKKQKPVKTSFNIHVLLAEDKKLNQKVAGMMLKNLGCTFDIANNGKEVIEKFTHKKYDLVLMDIMMPEMDGIEAMKHLKTKYKNVPPIIGLSAHALEGDAERFIKQGMDDYMEKPINRNKLAEKLNKWSA